MTFKEQVAKVKTLLSSVFEDIQPAAGETVGANTLQDYTTDGGVNVKIDKLEAGGMVYMEDGTTPVTTGFTLADGTIVAVDGNGMITDVTVRVAAAAPVIPPYVAGENPAFTAMRTIAEKFAAGTPEERIANLETISQAVMQYCFGWKLDEAARAAIEAQAIAAYKTLTPAQFSDQFSAKAELEALKTANDAKMQKFAETLNEVVKTMEAFAAQPSEDPAQAPSGAPDKPTKAERREQFARIIAEKNKKQPIK